MSNDLQTFTFDDLKKRIAEDVQAKFGSMIPPQVFEEMIEKSVRAFFESTTEKFNIASSGYSNQSITCSLTPFQIIVWDRLKRIVQPALDKWFDDKQGELKQMMEDTLAQNNCYGATLNSAVGPMVAGMAQLQALAAMKSATFPYQQQVAQTLMQLGIFVPFPAPPSTDSKDILKNVGHT